MLKADLGDWRWRERIKEFDQVSRVVRYQGRGESHLTDLVAFLLQVTKAKG